MDGNQSDHSHDMYNSMPKFISVFDVPISVTVGVPESAVDTPRGSDLDVDIKSTIGDIKYRICWWYIK